MAPVNNLERRAARKIAAAQGINYTEALRQVRNASIQPSTILNGETKVKVSQMASTLSMSDALEKMLVEVNHEAPGFEVTSSPLDFVRENSVAGKFAIKTAFSDDPSEKEYFVKSTHLALCGGAKGDGAELLSSLIIESGLSESNLVVWDSTGDWEGHDEIKVHPDLGEFNRRLKEVLDRGYENRTRVLIAVNGIDALMLLKYSEEQQESIHLLSKVLLEGRQRNIEL